MKKTLSIALFILVLVVLGACNNENPTKVPTTSPANEPTGEPAIAPITEPAVEAKIKDGKKYSSDSLNLTSGFV